MRTGENGKQLIKKSESLKLKTYLCPAGSPTIGYGHTGPDVKMGMEITEQQANELLDRDLISSENAVQRRVKVVLTQNQFDALVSFTFNLGEGALKDSTLLKKLNAEDYKGAADEFLKWNKNRVNGVLMESNGLTTRRQKERALFLS